MADVMLEWLNLAARWFHVVAAIAWIGASFYFIWLDLSLRQPPQWKIDKGIKGDLWAIHGGGIYEVAKYHTRPEVMPAQLHWFKWEAYSTWLSGSVLLVLMYYVQAQSYLVGFDSWITSPTAAIIASLLFLIGGQTIYEILLRTPLIKKGLVFAFALIITLTFASWLAHHLFSARAAFIHVGALMATWMAGNVFWGIIPAQKKFIAAVEQHQEPDVRAIYFAKLRSTHNNYLTLPVIFCMISNHYPFVYGHAHSWLAVIGIGTMLAWGRHFFNLKHQGTIKKSILFTSLLGIVFIAVVMSYTDKAAENTGNPTAATEEKSLDTQVQSVIETHCQSCHAGKPTQPGFVAPPAGLIISTPAQLTAIKVRALPALKSGYMPLGNLTGMSNDQRALLIQFLESP